MSDQLDEIKDSAAKTIRRAEDTASDIGKQVSQTAARARGHAQALLDDVDVAAARDSVARQTKAHPLFALAIASAVGLVIGRLLFPKRT